jgi:hypothetical protein
VGDGPQPDGRVWVGAGRVELFAELGEGVLDEGQQNGLPVGEVGVDGGGADAGPTGDGAQGDRLIRAGLVEQCRGCREDPGAKPRPPAPVANARGHRGARVRGGGGHGRRTTLPATVWDSARLHRLPGLGERQAGGDLRGEDAVGEQLEDCAKVGAGAEGGGTEPVARPQVVEAAEQMRGPADLRTSRRARDSLGWGAHFGDGTELSRSNRLDCWGYSGRHCAWCCLTKSAVASREPFPAPGSRTSVDSAVGRYRADVTNGVVLSAIPFFAGLDASVLAALSENAEEVCVAAGELIIEQGEAANDVYFLLEGSVEALLRFEGVGDLFMGTREALGTLLGWSAFRPPYRYSDSVRSHRPSRLLRVSRSSFDTLFARDLAVAHELLRRVNVEVAQQLEGTRELFESPHAQGQEL